MPRKGLAGPKMYEDWCTPERLEAFSQVVANGATLEGMAKHIGISPRTVERWRKAHPEFREAFVAGRQQATAQVESALFKNAIGYTATDQKYVVVKDEETGRKKKVLVEENKKQVGGSTSAQIFWLKNRAPDEWKDCKDLTLAGEIGIADRMKKARERVENAAGKQQTD